MMSYRRHKTPIVYILVLLVALAALWWGLGFATREDKAEEDQEVIEEEQILDERGSAPPSVTEGEPAGVPASDAQVALILKVQASAGTYLPESRSQEPIARIWFADTSSMYVEYYRSGSGSADRMAFFGTVTTGKEVKPVRLALYGQSESGWEFLEGEDVLFTKPQKDLYERNMQGEWVKVN